MFQLGYNSIGIVLIISFFIGAVICLQIKLNIQSAWMPTMVRIYNQGNYAIGVLIIHYVLDTGWKSRIQYRIRTRINENHTTN